MAEYKMCPNTDHAIYILEFIQRNYQKHSEDAGVQKYIEALQMGIDALKNQPTADVVEVKHGNWIFHNDGSGTCSVCGRHQKHIWDMCSWQKYCGHCGAKMDGRRDT